MNITNYGDSGPRVLQMGDPGSSQLREGDFIADRELALTKDDRVVEERDRDALFLLVAKGQVITREVAAKHGLRCEGGRCAWGPVAAAVEPEPDGAPDAANSEPETPAADDLSGMTKAQLLELAAERGVEVKERDTKAEILAALGSK